MPDSIPDPRPDDPDPDQVEGGQTGGRDRLFRSLFRPTRRQLTVGVLLALVGFAGVTQVRANEVDDSFASLREQDLIDLLEGLAGAQQRAEAERDRLEEARAGLSSTTSRRQAAIEQATTEADNLSILAGLVPVTGSGIRITIDEVDDQIKLSSMLDVIQELRTVGAEAMQINAAVRIVAQTSFEDAPGGFLVDGELMSPPYVIDVIGEPNVLEQAIVFTLGPKAQIERDGGTLEVDALASLDIETVRRPVQPEYAEPDLDQ
jgi:uncharacterized protein YlxW (UPF0749 family)